MVLGKNRNGTFLYNQYPTKSPEGKIRIDATPGNFLKLSDDLIASTAEKLYYVEVTFKEIEEKSKEEPKQTSVNEIQRNPKAI